MQYSLSSRFRGTLLGAVIAQALTCQFTEVLGSRQEVSKNEHPLWAGIDSPQFNCRQEQDQPFQLSQLAWLHAESLIQVGDLDLEYLHRSGDHQYTNTQPLPLTFADILVGIIPVSLFFHEDEAQLRQKILQATAVGHTSWELQSGALAVAYAIAQSLREKLDPASLIAQTIAYLPQPSEILVKQLEQVQRLLKQRAGLDAALSQLLKLQPVGSLPVNIFIALAFYCFLSTLEDYRLTVTRAAFIGHKSSLVAVLAGTLSGAYNSTTGIPLEYRLTLLQEVSQASRRSKTKADILQLADQLLAIWSGAYQPTNTSVETELNSEPAVAAPGVIRP
jgi:hypothetical protein